MSARLVKKVLNEKQHFPQHLSEEEEEEEELNGEDGGSIARSSINPFDLLNEDDSEPEPQEDELTFTNETLARYDDKEKSSSLKDTAEVSTSNLKSKKKKKKKNKDSAVANKTGGKKELDLVLEDLSLNVNSLDEQRVSTKANAENGKDKNKSVKHNAVSILQVDPKYLNAENELRRIFGSKVVRSFESSNRPSSSRQIRGVRRGHYNLRKTVLVTPSDNWLRCDDSLSMQFLEIKNGYNYFRYVFSPSYSQSQRAFEAAKAINDINGIASILQHRPYHLDSLLTMAEYFKVVGEQQMSADAIARCLYALECAWHPMFTPLQGNCQLKFKHDTNKPIFTALFTHMKNLDRRGCHRSALEVCKLLLSLDSDDPMGAIFCIDYFALRAEEYAWLEKFSEDYKTDNSIWLLPNFSFSLAICRFYLEREASKDASVDDKKASSSDLMKQALMLHPSVIKKLVAKVPLKERIWTDILQHSFFRSDQTGITSQDHLINIYVERNYLIWRLPDLQKLLSGAAKLVIETLESSKSEAKDWACVRKEAFSTEKNEYGHLLVSDFSDSVSQIPQENLQHLMGDPRMRAAMQDENEFANLQGNGHAPRGVANRNALAVLFESVLPWVTYEDREEGGPDDNQHDDHRQENE